MMFCVCCIICWALMLHWFSIDFEIDVGTVSLLMFCCYLCQFTHVNCKTLKHCFCYQLKCFYTTLKYFYGLSLLCSLLVLALMFDNCWHRFCIHCATPLGLSSMFVCNRFCFHDFGDDVFLCLSETVAISCLGPLPCLINYFFAFWPLLFPRVCFVTSLG